MYTRFPIHTSPPKPLVSVKLSVPLMKKPAPVSVQLWSLRDLTKTDFAGTMAKVAEIGFTGVETAGYGNLNVTEAAKAISDAGLKCSGMHVGLNQLRNDFDTVVNDAITLGSPHVICPSWPKQQFTTAAACEQIGAELNDLGARLRAHGIGFHFHNHDSELAIIDGKPVFDWMLGAAEPRNLGCQADVYWVHVGGKNPGEFIREQGSRIRLLHLKDETEIGGGPVDFQDVFAAIDSVRALEWQVIEVEKYNYAPLESVRLSFEQLKAWGRVPTK